jgi:hypothetical protein
MSTDDTASLDARTSPTHPGVRASFLYLLMMILASLTLLTQGCVISLPSLRATPVSDAVPTQVSSNQTSPNIVCVDAQGKQCMVCDSAGANCHFPVFKLP